MWNLHQATFIILFDHSEQKWFAKYLRYWNLKSFGCLLTHWLRMTTLLFRIVRVLSSLFKCNYLKNEKIFPKFLFRFWNLPEILIIFQKRMIVRANVFPRFQTVKTWLDYSLKSAVSEPSSTVSMLICMRALLSYFLINLSEND